jgi:hypothetical protein
MSSRGIIPLAAAIVLLVPEPAFAASPHVSLVIAGIPVLGTLGGLVGDVFSGIGHAVLGAFTWTIGLASKFLLTTIAALVKMLIPHSWVHKGLQIIEWIVAVPDYAEKITSPGGGQSYGFAGINQLREVFMWLGIAIAPLSLVYATSQAMIGEGDPVAIPLLRMLAVTVLIASYPYWWGQAAALTDQITNTILTLPEVSHGLYKLMDYAVDGVALGGWQLIDLGLMGAIGLELLGLIFLKVALIILGALLYATGPVMIGLVPTRAGHALARAWCSAAGMLLGLGIAWATIFAVGALLIGDAGTAGPLIGGNSAFGSLAGGLILAVAGAGSLWLCLKAGKEAAALLRLQLSGLLAFTGRRGSAASARTVGSRPRTTASSLREYGSRAARAAGAVTGELALAGPAGAATASAARSAAYVGRRGLIGTAASGARAGASRGAAPATNAIGRSRAGAVAARMARAGTASWTSSTPNASQARSPQRTPTRPEPGRNGRPAAPGRSPGKPGSEVSPAQSRHSASGNPRAARRQPTASAGGDRGSRDARNRAQSVGQTRENAAPSDRSTRRAPSQPPTAASSSPPPSPPSTAPRSPGPSSRPTSQRRAPAPRQSAASPQPRDGQSPAKAPNPKKRGER